MTQGALFEMAAAPAPTPIWSRAPGADGGKCGAVYTHVASGYVVQHCGHPTANFPYAIYTPDGERILASNGRGFQKLRFAQQHIEAITKGGR